MQLTCIPETPNIWGYQLHQQSDQINSNNNDNSSNSDSSICRQAVLVHSSTRSQAGQITWFDIKSEDPYDLNKVVTAGSLVNYPLVTVTGYSSLVDKVLLYDRDICVVYSRLDSYQNKVLVKLDRNGTISQLFYITPNTDIEDIYDVEFAISQQVPSNSGVATVATVIKMLTVTYIYYVVEYQHRKVYQYQLPSDW